jgi:pimeloyl-ACP methyl ester carboxylesterase
VRVAEGVELHYVDRGDGDSVILIHGGITDYSMWLNQIDWFARKYRVIAYSRRYNYPNTNEIQPNYSARVDAEDLFVLITKLKLGRVHLVGSSMGGRVALLFAATHPERTRSMTVQEAPIHFSGDPPDQGVVETFKAAGAASKSGNREAAVQKILDRLSGGQAKFDQLPATLQSRMLRNVREIEAYLAGEVETRIHRDDIRKITTPTLLLSGEKSLPNWKPFEEELLRLLPNIKHVLISGAAHGLFNTHAEQVNGAILQFLNGK